MESEFFDFHKNIFKLFFEKLAVCHFPNVIRSEGENNPPFTAARKEVNSLELTSSQMETNRYQFESFCKALLRNALNDILRRVQRVAENEVTFSELSQAEMDSLFAVDEYPVEHFRFKVDGGDVTIKNERLYHALSKLPPVKRDIVLLAVCFKQSDAKIAKKLNMVRSTVQSQRTSSLANLRKMMGGK